MKTPVSPSIKAVLQQMIDIFCNMLFYCKIAEHGQKLLLFPPAFSKSSANPYKRQYSKERGIKNYDAP